MVLVTQLSREDFVSDSRSKLSVVLLVTLSDLLIPIWFPLFYCFRFSKLLVFSPFFSDIEVLPGTSITVRDS